jgi:hypothetical protein
MGLEYDPILVQELHVAVKGAHGSTHQCLPLFAKEREHSLVHLNTLVGSQPPK